MTEERNTELEDKSTELSNLKYSELKKKPKKNNKNNPPQKPHLKTKKWNLRDLQYNIKRFNICIIRGPAERRKSKCNTKKHFEK